MVTSSTATLIKITKTSQFSPASPDPCGIVYLPGALPGTGSLLISDSEVEEMSNLYKGSNLYSVDLQGNLQSTLSTMAFTKEPTGIAYNPNNNHLYFSDDDKLKIFDLNPGADGKYNTADDTVTSFSVSGFSADPEDVVYSKASNTLFIMDGLNSQVYQISLTGTLISQFDTQSLGVLDPEGITIGPNGNLFIVGNPRTSNNAVYEITTAGVLVQKYDISAANPVKPAGLTFAPSSQNPSEYSLYIVDRGVDNNDVPTENDGRLYEFSLGNTTPPPATAGVLAFSAASFSVNEDGTAIASIQVTRTGGSSGAVSATVNLMNGTAIAPSDYNNSSIVVNFAAGDTTTKIITIPIVNDTEVESNETINLALSNPTNGATIGSQASTTLTIVDNDVASPAKSLLYVSPSSNGSVGGVTFADEDILSYDSQTGTWKMYFDGSDVGLSSLNVRDFHINSDGSILFALNNATTLTGPGSVAPTDIVKFTPTSTGDITAGTFSLYFKGANVGLADSGESIDAIAFAPDGRLVVSTKASFVVPGVSGGDEDLIAFQADSLNSWGANTAGTWTMYFDGSDVGLTDSTEDVRGTWIDASGKIYMSTEGAFNVTGATGDGSDIFTFTPTSTGSNTSGTFAPYWDGSKAGLTVAIDGITPVIQ
jgi:hypothetical protein